MVDRKVRLRRIFKEVSEVVMHLGIVGQRPQSRSETRRFEVRRDHLLDLDTTLRPSSSHIYVSYVLRPHTQAIGVCTKFLNVYTTGTMPVSLFKSELGTCHKCPRYLRVTKSFLSRLRCDCVQCRNEYLCLSLAQELYSKQESFSSPTVKLIKHVICKSIITYLIKVSLDVQSLFRRTVLKHPKTSRRTTPVVIQLFRRGTAVQLTCIPQTIKIIHPTL